MGDTGLVASDLPVWLTFCSTLVTPSKKLHRYDLPSLWEEVVASADGMKAQRLNTLLSEQGYATTRLSSAAHSTNTPGSRTMSAVLSCCFRSSVGISHRKHDLPTGYGAGAPGAIVDRI